MSRTIRRHGYWWRGTKWYHRDKKPFWKPTGKAKVEERRKFRAVVRDAVAKGRPAPKKRSNDLELFWI